MKITAKAKTTNGQTGFDLYNPDLLRAQITPMQGELIITIELVQGDATDEQIGHFRNVVVPTFLHEAHFVGQTDFTEESAECFLLRLFAKVESIEEITENGKKRFSEFIDACKLYINEFFNANLE